MRTGLRMMLACKRGATAMEYAFLAALVSTGIVGALAVMSGSLSGLFTSISSSVSGAAGG